MFVHVDTPDVFRSSSTVFWEYFCVTRKTLLLAC